MAYNGYLFKFGDFTFPMKYIADEGYDCAPHQRQSLDSYTDENGLTHDNALPHSKTEVKISTLAMPGEVFDSIMSNFTKNFISNNARDAQCTYYDIEKNAYSAGHMYFDKSFRAKLKIKNGKPYYSAMDWTFIEY
jgi:hypothetical protein